ncbi:hypothetical protein G6N82_01275 [Altererythrobacter sp. BO-6]|nr:hypothetical protein G6N82_01275 [Altererythrobacter sp. BO-6]
MKLISRSRLGALIASRLSAVLKKRREAYETTTGLGRLSQTLNQAVTAKQPC